VVTGVQLGGTPVERCEEVLTREACEFLAGLHKRFAPRRAELLAARSVRQEEAVRTGELDFLPETRGLRECEWQVAQAPADLGDRRVEITGPTEAKMAVNALNSGAQVWLADFEDANTPHWANVISGQVTLLDAVRDRLEFTSGEGKHYAQRADVANPAIVVRPRGWHLDERAIGVGGEPAVGALVDFGLYFFHNAAALLAKGSGPYFYLPKLESHLEARLWDEVFSHAEAAMAIPHGTIRATVLIETIPAAFEMEEILYELREHASGLNAGRWDYLFSLIKYFREAGSEFVLPDRNSVTMTAPFMRAYTELLVRTCHKRGAFAIGGMAAFIPTRRDPEVNEAALAKVADDKHREANDGFDGSWVAHPDLVEVCRAEFDKVLGDKPNQLDRTRDDVTVTPENLLNVAATDGRATMGGLRAAVDVGVRYIASWLSGTGAAGIHNLMEDAATAEITRSQVWQWVANHTELDTGEKVDESLVRQVIEQTRTDLTGEIGPELLNPAIEIFTQVALADEFVEFLTIPAYKRIS
jgi:malate synthase